MTLALVMGSPRPLRMASDQASSFDPLGVSYSAVACGTRLDDGADADGVGEAGGGVDAWVRRGAGGAVVGRAWAIMGGRIITASAPSGLPWLWAGAVVAGWSWRSAVATGWCPGRTANAAAPKAQTATAATAQLTRAAVPYRVLRRRVSRSMAGC